MNKYWISQYDPNWVFWAHEFSKHATCFSTFQKECFGPKAAEHDDLFEFFETVISFYQRLPTYRWLKADRITPSNSTGYTLSDIQTALKTGFGELPFVGCSGPRYNETEAGKGSTDNGRTQFSEVWYYYHIRGRPQDRHGVKSSAQDTGFTTTCAKTDKAVWYYQRAKGSEW